MADDLERAIDALYQAPLSGFVAARNALAARLGREGDKDAARRVKALAKPGPVAWIVNQLAHADPGAFDALVAAGEDIRQGLAAGDRAGMDRATAARDTVVAGLVRDAGPLYGEAGAATDDLRRRVRLSLEALAAYGRGPQAPRAGRLVRDVTAPTVGTLAALIPAGARVRGPAERPGRPLRSRSSEGRARRADLEIALERAERERAKAERAATAADADAASRRAAHEAARRGVTMLERRLEDAVAFERRTKKELDAAERARATAAEALATAERRVKTARSAASRGRPTGG